jgi:hydrogenase maturation protease
MIAIIGCGNLNRSDDGAGVAVVRALGSRDLGDGVHLYDAGTDGIGVMFAARGARALIVVDACRLGVTPGALYEVPGSELHDGPQVAIGLHDFRWDHALHAGRKIYGASFPDDVVVLLIEAATVGLGVGLSPVVAAAVERAADRVVDLVRARQAPATLQRANGTR